MLINSKEIKKIIKNILAMTTQTKKQVIATTIMVASVFVGTTIALYAWEKGLKSKLISTPTI